MAIFSNDYFFPIFQIVLLAILICAVYIDYFKHRSGIPAEVNRGPESMSVLQKATGLVIAGVVTIINMSVFDSETIWKNYSGFFNTLDLVSIIYFCYFSSWGRNKIIAINIRTKTEKR